MSNPRISKATSQWYCINQRYDGRWTRAMIVDGPGVVSPCLARPVGWRRPADPWRQKSCSEAAAACPAYSGHRLKSHTTYVRHDRIDRSMDNVNILVLGHFSNSRNVTQKCLSSPSDSNVTE